MPRQMARIIAPAFLPALLAACAAMPLPDPVRNETERPSVNATTFVTSAIRCAGTAIDAQSRPNTPRLIVVSALRDADEAPGGTTPGQTARLLAPHMGAAAIQMMNTAAVLGATDTRAAQRLATRMVENGIPRPDVIHLLGGTLIERSAREEGAQIGGGPVPTSGSIGFDQSDTVYHLTLTTVDEGGLATPGLTYQIEARARRDRRNLRLGISTQTYNVNLDYAQTGNSITASQAANTLIQLGVLGVVTQALGLDVAPCIRRAHIDAEHGGWWEAATPDEQRRQTIALMQANGLLPAGSPAPAALAEAAARFQQSRNLPTNGFLDRALYIELRAVDAQRTSQVTAGRTPARTAQPGQPPLRVSIATPPTGPGGAHRLNSEFALRVESNAGRYVYCFMDTPTGVMRVLPNPLQINAFIPAGEAVRIPPLANDQQGPRIMLAALGRYTAGCVATLRALPPDTLRETRAQAGENLVGITVREALNAVGAASGGDAVTEIIDYTVIR